MITWTKQPRRSVWGQRWTYKVQVPELEPYVAKSITINLARLAVGKIQQKGNTFVVPVDNSGEVKLLQYLESANHRLQNPLWE